MGIIISIFGILIAGSGILLLYFPSSSSTITVNGVTSYPGSVAYKQDAQNILLFGLLLLFIAVILIISSVLVKKIYFSGDQPKNDYNRSSYSTPNSQSDFIPPRNYPFTNEPQQNDSFANSLQEVNSYTNSIQDSDSYSSPYQQSESNYDNTSQPDSFYNDAQKLDPFSNSNNQSFANSSNSDKFCSACGSPSKPNQQYCDNCGAKL